jgi:hypothetical protein
LATSFTNSRMVVHYCRARCSIVAQAELGMSSLSTRIIYSEIFDLARRFRQLSQIFPEIYPCAAEQEVSNL